ncbi:hypothetical protein [Sphingobium boeckii]|uniref:Uncharacterized protein n=1 Tax=Sphingobium boeckii TaxID=1082345 RepID=A0A7W9EDE9_9SPHN|nr:hypothetical protein [Sphingobium boeckii]MBB5684859.1 hypothetical protein [Sphingobium boeckii]
MFEIFISSSPIAHGTTRLRRSATRSLGVAATGVGAAPCWLHLNTAASSLPGRLSRRPYFDYLVIIAENLFSASGRS